MVSCSRQSAALVFLLAVAAHLMIGQETNRPSLGCRPAVQAEVNHAEVSPALKVSDITAKTGIGFTHLSSTEKRYIVESMSGGVALIDFDRDGWPDIFFTNAPDVDMFLAGKKARSALYRNNRDGTFTDVTDKAGVSFPCWAMGATVGDYNNDGWPDLLVSLLRRRRALSKQWRRHLY